MNQIWISAVGTIVPVDHFYVPVDEGGQAQGAKRRFRESELFPAPPDGAAGWLPEEDVVMEPRQS